MKSSAFLAALAASLTLPFAKSRTCPALANGLHKWGGLCRRLGGKRVCGECVHDLLPQHQPKPRQQ